MQSDISKPASRRIFLFVILLASSFVFIEVPFVDNLFINNADAVVGRPASPGSAAGVKRRTRRRTVKVVATTTAATATVIVAGTRVATLPQTCSQIISGGEQYYLCDGVYYKPYYEGTEVVYVVVDKPK
jgi:hypothetical protein